MSGLLDNLLSVEEVAEKTGLSKQWWKARARSKQVAHYRLGGVYKFDWNDVERALGATRIEAEADITSTLRKGRPKGSGAPRATKPKEGGKK